MKKYFYSDGKQKYGPLSFDELKREGILNHHLIWFEGLENWTPAGELDEMKPILELQPPPILNEEKNKSIKQDEETMEAIEKNEFQSRITRKGIFYRLFSYEGRIGRTEYGISLIIYFVGVSILNVFVVPGEVTIFNYAYILMIWFILAQGAKRCHDIGKNGFWQFIPFYVFWLLFQGGQRGLNKYDQISKW